VIYGRISARWRASPVCCSSYSATAQVSLAHIRSRTPDASFLLAQDRRLKAEPRSRLADSARGYCRGRGRLSHRLLKGAAVGVGPMVILASPTRREVRMEESWSQFRAVSMVGGARLVSPLTDSRESSPVALSSIVLAS